MTDKHQVLIFNESEIIGYCHTWQEADDICKKHSYLTWEEKSKYIKSISNNKSTTNHNKMVFQNLLQLTIQSDIKNTNILN